MYIVLQVFYNKARSPTTATTIEGIIEDEEDVPLVMGERVNLKLWFEFTLSSK